MRADSRPKVCDRSTYRSVHVIYSSNKAGRQKYAELKPTEINQIETGEVSDSLHFVLKEIKFFH